MTVHLVALFPGSESLKDLETTVRSHSGTLADLSSPLLIPLPYSPSLPFPLLLSRTLLPHPLFSLSPVLSSLCSLLRSYYSLCTVDKHLSMDYYSDVSVALLDNCSFLTACLYVPLAFVAHISLHAVQHCCQNVVSFPG